MTKKPKPERERVRMPPHMANEPVWTHEEAQAPDRYNRSSWGGMNRFKNATYGYQDELDRWKFYVSVFEAFKAAGRPPKGFTVPAHVASEGQVSTGDADVETFVDVQPDLDFVPSAEWLAQFKELSWRATFDQKTDAARRARPAQLHDPRESFVPPYDEAFFADEILSHMAEVLNRNMSAVDWAAICRNEAWRVGTEEQQLEKFGEVLIPNDGPEANIYISRMLEFLGKKVGSKGQIFT